MDFTFGLSIFGAVLGALGTVLHFVAPLTKWKGDDKAAKVVDFVQEKVMPVASALAPSMDKPADKPVVGFDTTESRDHRSK